MLRLTHHTEILPHQHPLTGPHRAAGIQAAHAELDECRELLRVPGPLYASPRMIRRYTEAQQAVNTYKETVK